MAAKKRSQSIENLTVAFIDRLTLAMERAIDARVRVLTVEWASLIPVAATAPQGAKSHREKRGPREPAASRETSVQVSAQASPGKPTTPAPVPRRRTRGAGRLVGRARAAAPPPPPDPQRQSRDAELARLRALLKPTAPEDLPVAARPIAHAAIVAVDSPPDPIRVLEDEVREQAHALGQLPSAGCTARIAAWAGRVRAYEETTGNRIAAQLLLEKLRALAHAMEAGHVEALRSSWRTTDWPAYIRRNEALAEAPPPLTPDSTPYGTPAAGSNDDEDPWASGGR